MKIHIQCLNYFYVIFVDTFEWIISVLLLLSWAQNVMVDYSGFFPQADGVTDLVMDVAGVTRKTSAKAVSFKSSHHFIIIIIYIFFLFLCFSMQFWS